MHVFVRRTAAASAVVIVGIVGLATVITALGAGAAATRYVINQFGTRWAQAILLIGPFGLALLSSIFIGLVVKSIAWAITRADGERAGFIAAAVVWVLVGVTMLGEAWVLWDLSTTLEARHFDERGRNVWDPVGTAVFFATVPAFGFGVALGFSGAADR